MKINDFVIIKDDLNPLIYIIEDICDDTVYLRGYSHRIKLKKNICDIELANEEQISKEKERNNKYRNNLLKIKNRRTSIKPLFGRILHIDGDIEYLNSCLNLYKEVGIYAEGIYIKEEKIQDKIDEIIQQTTPDIIVITGHDIYNGKGIKELSNYENTSHFINAVRVIRRRYSFNEVVIIVGACCSNFEALIASGANFASSPSRINIHTYDPAVIAITVASTSVNKDIDFKQCLKMIENGKDAFGGVETKGKMRLLL